MAVFLQGNFFDPAKWTKVTDPQCANVTSLQGLNGSGRCSLTALARIVPAGTAGTVTDAAGNSAVIVLQNPLPGHVGNLGQNVLRGLAPWRFDLNISKAFKVTEGTKLQFRADAVNVLNHPQAQFATNNLSINNSSTIWGSMTSKTGGRTFQAQLRLDF